MLDFSRCRPHSTTRSLPSLASGRLGWSPAFLGRCTNCTPLPRRRAAKAPARQPILIAILRSLCALQSRPAQRVLSHAALHHPPGYTGGGFRPAAADAAASALRALRSRAEGCPPPSGSSRMCPVSLQPHSRRIAVGCAGPAELTHFSPVSVVGVPCQQGPGPPCFQTRGGLIPVDIPTAATASTALC